jgi:hypothetical protein
MKKEQISDQTAQIFGESGKFLFNEINFLIK